MRRNDFLLETQEELKTFEAPMPTALGPYTSFTVTVVALEWLDNG